MIYKHFICNGKVKNERALLIRVRGNIDHLIPFAFFGWPRISGPKVNIYIYIYDIFLEFDKAFSLNLTTLIVIVFGRMRCLMH